MRSSLWLNDIGRKLFSSPMIHVTTPSPNHPVTSGRDGEVLGTRVVVSDELGVGHCARAVANIGEAYRRSRRTQHRAWASDSPTLRDPPQESTNVPDTGEQQNGEQEWTS